MITALFSSITHIFYSFLLAFFVWDCAVVVKDSFGDLKVYLFVICVVKSCTVGQGILLKQVDYCVDCSWFHRGGGAYNIIAGKGLCHFSQVFLHYPNSIGRVYLGISLSGHGCLDYLC